MADITERGAVTTPSYGCSFPGCVRHPRHGDTILRISAKGVAFVGRCEEHYGDETGTELARQYEDVARNHKGYSQETCVRCGWTMGDPPLNCQNDDTPHRFSSQGGFV